MYLVFVIENNICFNVNEISFKIDYKCTFNQNRKYLKIAKYNIWYTKKIYCPTFSHKTFKQLYLVSAWQVCIYKYDDSLFWQLSVSLTVTYNYCNQGKTNISKWYFQIIFNHTIV